MRFRLTIIAIFSAFLASASPSWACGFGEAPGGCGDSAESDARYMLLRVAVAIKADKARALQQFTRGEGGFRTQDTYVFCVGPDGVMSAHPSPLLQGHDVRDLHDTTGNYFIATMMKTAKPGEVAEIHYLFPRPGGTVAVPKTTYYTRADDQVCGVGVYEGDESPAVTPTPAPASRTERLAQLRQRLSSEMPRDLKSDWADFLSVLDEQEAAIAKAREQVEAAELTLTASR